MTALINTNPYGTLDLVRLSHLEESLSEVLPAECRAFLVENNGACVVPEEIIFPGQSAPYTLIECLFGLHDGADSLHIIRQNVVDSGVVPVEALPIAADHGGNLICIGLKGNHRGHIFYWDHGHSRPGVTDGDWHGMILLAQTFNGFIASLGRPQAGLHNASANA